MYRLTLILIALALPIVGMAQTNCIDDPGAEFVFNDTIHNFNYCSPTSLSTELTACYLEQIKVTFSGVENPDMLVIDIRRPGANYPMRFASSGLLSSENYDGFLSQDSCPSSQIIPWDNSTLGGGFFILNVSGWSGYNLTGIWDVGLSFIGSSFTPNEISLDFVGSCLSCSGCMDYTACNYDPSATSDDGSCDFISCYQLGCTDPSACNYDSAADTNDGSCEFTSCVGCTDSTACNYDSTATIAFEGSCIYLVTGYNCDGSCIVDSDGDGICNLFEILGCTDVLSENYNPLATDDDGSCVIFISGCTYSAACNYNEMATSDDGSCDFDSCYTVIEGCTYPNACNYSASAIEDDGTCFYPDVVGVCGGNCTSDADNDGICDDIDDCVGIVDVCGVCNGQGLCGGGIPIWLEISNPFLEMSYVQNAAPFFSMYNGWFDADFVKIGICNPQVNLAQGQGQASSSAFTISINFEDSPEFVVTVEAPLFQQVLTLQLPSGPNAPTASQIVSIRLQDDTGNTLDNLYQDGTPWPNVTLNGINHAPGQHRIVRQPGVLQGNTEVNESEWLVADENQDVPYFSSWNLGSTIMVPMVEDDQGENDQGCQGDEDGDGICDELEIPMFCDNVNTTNYSPLHNTLICEEAEVMEYWISSFNLAEIAQQGGLLPPMDLGQEPVASEMVASSICSTGASQLAFCNYGQRAFVVNENMRSVDIINYGDLGNPVPISDGIGGFRSISANDIASELVLRGLTSVLRAGLVPSDVDIYNMEGPDNMVAVAWIDPYDLTLPGWVTLHNTNGILFDEIEAIHEVGPNPRSLAFSPDGEWLVVACSGEGEYDAGDPKAEIVCINVLGYTQDPVAPTWANVVSYTINFDDEYIVGGGPLAITGFEARTSQYDGTPGLSHLLEPSHVAITPDSQRAFVNCQVNNTLVEVNLGNVISGLNVIQGAYGFGYRDMSSGNGFDGIYDEFATVATPTPGTILGWYQPGDMEIVVSGLKTILLTANEGLPSKNAGDTEDVNFCGGCGDYSSLEIDARYGSGATGNPSDPSYVFGSRSFSLWDITTTGSLSQVYDSESLIEDKLAELMPYYANSLKSSYTSGDQASISRGPEPAGIAHGMLDGKDILIVSLEEMGGSMIFNINLDDLLNNYSVSYQAYATNRDFQNPTMDQCAFNHLGAKDVLFLSSTITGNTSVTGGNEGYESILVSNDETGSLTLFSLDSNFKVPGCMDSCACNYSQYATVDDLSCEFISCEGCTYDDAVNYDSAATLDNGTCTFNTTANACPADLDGDSSVSTSDLLIFLSAFGTAC